MLRFSQFATLCALILFLGCFSFVTSSLLDKLDTIDQTEAGDVFLNNEEASSFIKHRSKRGLVHKHWDKFPEECCEELCCFEEVREYSPELPGLTAIIWNTMAIQPNSVKRRGTPKTKMKIRKLLNPPRNLPPPNNVPPPRNLPPPNNLPPARNLNLPGNTNGMCDPPDANDNSYYLSLQSSYQLGENVTYYCDVGYDQDTLVRHCVPGNMWTDSALVCTEELYVPPGILTGQDCFDKKNSLNQSTILSTDPDAECVDPCGDESITYNVTNCPSFCQINGIKCIPKLLSSSDVENSVGDPLVIPATLRDNETSERNLFVGGGQGQNPLGSILGGTYGRPGSNFPHDCGINIYDTNSLYALLEPPIDVPYCLRIPCRASDPTLEMDGTRCQAHPGCFYDRELAYRKRGLSYGALSRVPVCHLAVRNKAFQRLANDYVQRSQQPWNALYTRCLIEQNLPAIQQPDPGCPGLRFMFYVSIFPKIAGWRGMSDRDCHLFNGCHFPHHGHTDYTCYHPTSTSRVTVRAGEDPHRSFNPTPSDLYGQPMCRPFNSTTPQSYLYSYHQCLQSGCVLDSSINSQSLQSQYIQLMLSSAVHQRVPFWHLLNTGQLLPGSWEQQLNNFVQSIAKCPCANMPNPSPIPYNLVLDGGTTGRSLGATPSICSLLTTPPPVPSFPSFLFPSLPLSGTVFPPGAASISGLSPQLLSMLCPTYQQPNVGCPYHNSQITGYPPLRGSFEGCCEQNLCYIPRSQVVTQKSGVSSYYTEYSEWTECSAPCGGGISNRTRKCVRPNVGANECPEGDEEVQLKLCNIQDCPYWGDYGAYEPCSSTCGVGVWTRRRPCVNGGPNGEGCIGNAEETSPCVNPDEPTCPTCGPFGAFTECCCGPNELRTRTQTCTRYDGSTFTQTDTGNCPVLFCGETVENVSPCNPSTCMETVTRTCHIDSPNDCDRKPYCGDLRPTARRCGGFCFGGSPVTQQLPPICAQFNLNAALCRIVFPTHFN